MPTMRRTKDEWLAVFRNLAKTRQGRCDSAAYINQRTKLDFTCSEGHLFSATPVNVLHHDSWCPQCAGNARLSIEDVRQAAADLGCVLLSDAYDSVHKPLEFRCSRGHRFTASTTSVRTMKGACMECQKLELSEFERLAESIG